MCEEKILSENVNTLSLNQPTLSMYVLHNYATLSYLGPRQTVAGTRDIQSTNSLHKHRVPGLVNYLHV